MITYWQFIQFSLLFLAVTLVFQYFVMGACYKLGFKAALADIQTGLETEFKAKEETQKTSCFYMPEETSACVH